MQAHTTINTETSNNVEPTRVHENRESLPVSETENNQRPGPGTPSNPLGAEFLSNLAHQLRSPLSSLRVWVDLLNDPAALASPEDMMRLVEGIDRATSRLERQITDVLEAGYLEAGTLTVTPAPVDAFEQIVQAVESTGQAANSRKIKVNLDLDSHNAIVMADRARLKQVMVCLLANAIKFSPVGGAITVSAGPSAHVAGDGEATTILEPTFEGRSLSICVSDKGAGITDSLHHEVFKPFYKASRKDAHAGGGSGLGLAIVAGLVGLHHGGIWLRSNPNVGTDIEISLPQASNTAVTQ